MLPTADGHPPHRRASPDNGERGAFHTGALTCRRTTPSRSACGEATGDRSRKGERPFPNGDGERVSLADAPPRRRATAPIFLCRSHEPGHPTSGGGSVAAGLRATSAQQGGASNTRPQSGVPRLHGGANGGSILCVELRQRADNLRSKMDGKIKYYPLEN